MEYPVIKTRPASHNKMAFACLELNTERSSKEKIPETITTRLLDAFLAGLNGLSAMAWPGSDTDKAGMTGLPLNCQGMYCAEVRILAWGQAMMIIHDDCLNGWPQTEAAVPCERDWSWDANIF